MDDVFEVRLVNQSGEFLGDVGAEFVALKGEFVGDFGATNSAPTSRKSSPD